MDIARPIKVILRLQPVQSYNDGMKEYDLSDKLLLEGVGQAVLPEVIGTNDRFDIYERELTL